jgi:hypothetical protein
MHHIYIYTTIATPAVHDHCDSPPAPQFSFRWNIVSDMVILPLVLSALHKAGPTLAVLLSNLHDDVYPHVNRCKHVNWQCSQAKDATDAIAG